MPREWTEEQRKAQGERLRLAREAKAAKEAAKQPEVAPEPVEAPANDPGVAELTAMVLELQQKLQEQEKQSPQNDLVEALKALAGDKGNGPQVSGGRVVGKIQKYSTDLKKYPNPIERLANEPRLRRIAFDNNYELIFEAGVTSYETKDGLNYEEPKFSLKLVQIVLDENGEATNQRIGKAKMIFFEDPATAMEVANRMGLPIDEENEEAFLNEMRYMRMREWLFECFWPGARSDGRGNVREMVVNGQVVEIWEVNTESNATIPFDKLNKLKI